MNFKVAVENGKLRITYTGMGYTEDYFIVYGSDGREIFRGEYERRVIEIDLPKGHLATINAFVGPELKRVVTVIGV